MNLSDYAKHDGLALAALIKAKHVSAKEVAQATSDAISKINPTLNAIAEVYEERIEGDNILPQSNKPFGGVPFLVKDLGILEQGKKMEAGSRLAKGMVAPVDSELMKRFTNSGFNNVGRTTCPEFGFSCSTESLLNGRTTNPWDTGMNSGGSSGGSAASVASGIVPIAHASDAGGSIRGPASCCGVFGLKPSRGRVSFAPSGEGFNGLANEHVFSRTVRDSAAVLDITSGFVAGDPYGIALPEMTFLEACTRDPKPLKIAFSKVTNGGHPLDPEIIFLLEKTAKLCEELGHHVEETQPIWDERMFIESSVILWAANCFATCNMLATLSGNQISEHTVELINLTSYRLGKTITAETFVNSLENMNRISRQIAPFFQQYDLFLTPTLTNVGIKNNAYVPNEFTGSVTEWFERLSESGGFLSIYNMTGQPAMSVPICISNKGFPVGVHFAAPYAKEVTLYQLAGQLERVKPWSHRIPFSHVTN